MADSKDRKEYWWDQKPNICHEQVFSLVRFLHTNQNWLRENDIRNMRLYGNLSVTSPSIGTPTINLNAVTDRLSLNVVQSMCDTVTNKIAKNKPKPMFLTQGGDFRLQKKAKLLNKFIDGQFYASKVYNFDRGPMSFRDSTIFGDGYVKIYKSGKEICVDRVFPPDLITDESEGMYGNPRTRYEQAYLPKEHLIKLYPKFEAQIESAKSAESIIPGHSGKSNYVWVIEAWHLSSTKEAKDGRHVICIENATIIDEVYKKTYFPFARLSWSPRVLGFRGQSLAEQLTGLQVEINRILRDIQITMHLFKPKYLVEMGSKMIKAVFNNEIGSLMYYDGIKPEAVAPNAVPGEWFTHLQNLYNKGYEIAGVSQLSANSKKPAGLDSGKALREYSDIESERFVLSEMAWQDFHLEIARQMIDLAKEIAEENNGDFFVNVKDRDKILKINWKDINLESDQYMMQLFPTNFLSETPAGKLQDVTELSQAGLIDQEWALRLLDFPDLEGYTRMKNGPIDDILTVLEDIMYDGKYSRPEPFQKLEVGISIMQSSYLWARANKVPEDRLEMIRRWMEEADRMIQDAKAKMAAAMAPPAAPAVGALPARPEQAPTNALLPPVA